MGKPPGKKVAVHGFPCRISLWKGNRLVGGSGTSGGTVDLPSPPDGISSTSPSLFAFYTFEEFSFDPLDWWPEPVRKYGPDETKKRHFLRDG
jgi:hypothetical protein